MRFLGIISYSIYLLHHMLLHILAQWILGPQAFAALEGWRFSGVILVLGCATLVLATLAYLWVEKPWMQNKPVAKLSPAQPAMAQ